MTFFSSFQKWKGYYWASDIANVYFTKIWGAENSLNFYTVCLLLIHAFDQERCREVEVTILIHEQKRSAKCSFKKKVTNIWEKNYLISLVQCKKKFLNFLKKLTLHSLLIRKKIWILLQYMFFFPFIYQNISNERWKICILNFQSMQTINLDLVG